MKWRAPAVAVLLILLAGCARSTVRIIPNDQLPPDLYPRNVKKAEQGSTTRVVTLFMLEGNRMVQVERTGRVRRGTSGPTLAVRALLAGPTQQELTDDGYTTALPAPVELIGVTRKDTVAQVDFSREFLKVRDRDEYLLRIAQVVYTLTELEKIDSVQFLVEGQRQPVPDQDGRQQTDPVARGRYDRFAPRNPFGTPASEGPLKIDIPGPVEEADPS